MGDVAGRYRGKVRSGSHTSHALIVVRGGHRLGESSWNPPPIAATGHAAAQNGRCQGSSPSDGCGRFHASTVSSAMMTSVSTAMTTTAIRSRRCAGSHILSRSRGRAALDLNVKVGLLADAGIVLPPPLVGDGHQNRVIVGTAGGDAHLLSRPGARWDENSECLRGGGCGGIGGACRWSWSGSRSRTRLRCWCWGCTAAISCSSACFASGAIAIDKGARGTFPQARGCRRGRWSRWHGRCRRSDSSCDRSRWYVGTSTAILRRWNCRRRGNEHSSGG